MNSQLILILHPFPRCVMFIFEVVDKGGELLCEKQWKHSCSLYVLMVPLYYCCHSEQHVTNFPGRNSGGQHGRVWRSTQWMRYHHIQSEREYYSCRSVEQAIGLLSMLRKASQPTLTYIDLFKYIGLQRAAMEDGSVWTMIVWTAIPGGGSFTKIVCGCACRTSKIWLSLYQFFAKFPTHQYSIFERKALNFDQIGCFLQ